MARVEEQVPGEPKQVPIVLVQAIWIPAIGPEMGTHFRSYTGAGIVLDAVLAEDNMYIIALLVANLTIDALPLTEIRVMGIDYKSSDPDHCALADSADLRGERSQERSVSRKLAVAAECDLIGSILLQLS
jgi:hypothetical protein